MASSGSLLILPVISLPPLSEVFPPSQVFPLTHGSIHSCEGFQNNLRSIVRISERILD